MSLRFDFTELSAADRYKLLGGLACRARSRSTHDRFEMLRLTDREWLERTHADGEE